MSIEYHKHLDRILVRRAAETESLERQVESNKPGPKLALAAFAFGLAAMAFMFMPMLWPLWLAPIIGGMYSIYGAISVWAQIRTAQKALNVEQTEEDYRRYLLGKLGPKKFDQLAQAVVSGGSEASLRGWLKPLGFDEHDIEYLLWLTEALLDSMNSGGALELLRGKARTERGARSAEKTATTSSLTEREASDAADVQQPPEPPVAELAERAASEPAIAPLLTEREASASATEALEATPPKEDSGPSTPDSGPKSPRLSPEEVAKFKQLAAQRKQEYEKWLAAGGRDSDPDDPFGKLKDFSPEKIAELKRKAQERRKQGAAPTSAAPAPGATDHPGMFDEREMTELARKALSRFEPKPQSGEAKPAPGATLGHVFSTDELAALKGKAERESSANKPAGENDPEWGEQP